LTVKLPSFDAKKASDFVRRGIGRNVEARDAPRFQGIGAPGAPVTPQGSISLLRRTLLHPVLNLTMGVAALLAVSQAAWAQADACLHRRIWPTSQKYSFRTGG
jgi:hypothetical protein